MAVDLFVATIRIGNGAATAGLKQTIGGFRNSHIGVVDITNPAAVTALRRTITRQGTSCAASVVPQGSGTRTLLAFTSA